MATNLLTEALAGYDAPAGAASPHLHTSPADYGWRVGQHFNVTGKSRPRSASMSRGHKVRCNDQLIECKLDGTFERLS